MAGGKKGFDPAAQRKELIRQITDNQRVAADKMAEAQSYAPARELLTDGRLGLGVGVNQVVVDSPVPFGRERPDIQVWLEGVPANLRNESEHLYTILELKSGTKVQDSGRSIAKDELQTYSYRKLRHFYLADSVVIQRYDLVDETLPEPDQKLWTELENQEVFETFFAPLTADRRTLRAQLANFTERKLPPGRKIENAKDRKRFVDAIVTTARILSASVDSLVTAKLVPDLELASATIAKLSETYGTVEFDFSGGDPIIFADEPDVDDLDEHARFNVAYTELLGDIEERLYALRAEVQDLPAYALRSGLKPEHASFLKVKGGKKEVRDVAISARASYVQETATLLFSRLLMIRFSEDHSLLPRILSNGGLTSYATFAQHSSGTFQSLVSTAYRKARPIYRHLFEPKPLDWLLESDDPNLSEALLHAMWIMAGWDFTTVRGDLLSGIYDRNLDRAQRQALGEVYTRPELAAYMLTACGYDGSQTVLDPACGSGTFLVEAFEAARRRKDAAGVDFNEDDIVETLSKLHGMDVNGFSATLAQIQLLWHVLSIGSSDRVSLMRRAISALSVEGGHSSLETWGASMQENDLFAGVAGRVSEEIKAARKATDRRLRTADRRFRDMSVRKHGFEIVAGNPPFVRVQRVRLSEAQKTEYATVRTKQSDLSVLFAYRALKWWIAPGGKLGFYLPLAISEAAYAEPLRRMVDENKIIEIVDLEEIGNVAFHGANIVTMGLVVEKTPPSDTDLIRMTRVTPECLNRDTGLIEMDKAISEMVPRSTIDLARYLPGAIVSPAASDGEDLEDEDGDAEEAEESGGGISDSAWLTKIRVGDVPVLETIASNRRLDDIILIGWKKLGKGGAQFAAEPPSNGQAIGWKPARVMGYGVKIGGALDPSAPGLPVYKAKHLPPDGTIDGDPMGKWNGDPSLVDTVRFYAWEGIGEQANTYVIRNIATQPVFAPHPADVYFTNTVYCYRLAEPFPLNVWSVSRVVAWFMAMTSRTSIVQGFFHTVYQRHTRRMPIPAQWDGQFIKSLDDLGKRIFAADAEIARGQEELDKLVGGEGSMKLRNRLDLIEEGKVSSPKAVSLPDAEAKWENVRVRIDEEAVSFVTEDEDGQTVPAPTQNGALCEIKIVDDKLRRWIGWLAGERLASGRLPDQDWLQNLPIPDDRDRMADLLTRHEQDAAKIEFDKALEDLDQMVATALGLSEEQLQHILTAFQTDMMLRHVSPQWRHGGNNDQTVDVA